MRIVLDFDGTVYDPGVRLKDYVLPRFEMLLRRCALEPGEEVTACRARLEQKYGTKNLFICLHLECNLSESYLLQETYLVGLEQFNPLVLREGIQELLTTCGRVDILSNAPVRWLAYALLEMNVAQYVGGVYGVDPDHLVTKPARAAFEQVPHDDVLFIDDDYDNCVAAADFGWSTLWFPPVELVEESDDERVVRIHTGLDALEYLKTRQ